MFKRKGVFVILCLIILLLWMNSFFNRPQEAPFPFAAPIELLPDYRPPMEGVTLYPTGGPFGFDIIETIAVSPKGSIFVGTFGGGLFRSDDVGRHWEPASRGLRDKFIASLIILEENNVFVGTVRSGLFQSRDNGENWTPAGQGMENREVNTMVMLASGDILAGTGFGPYISRNNGKSWEAFNKGLNDVRIHSLAEAKDGTLFAATHGRGIFKRVRGGKQWELAIPGFSYEDLEERVVRTLAIGRGNALFAGTMSAGVFLSLDGGKKWKSVNQGLTNYSIRTLAMDGSGTLYVGTGEGVFFSHNNGERWTPLLEGMSNTQIHSFVVNKKGDLYVGSAGGVFRGRIERVWEPIHEELQISPLLSLDYGREGITVGTHGKGTYINNQDNWVSDNLGLVNLSIMALARGPIYLYAITQGGIYRRQLVRHRWEAIQGRYTGVPMSIGVDSDGHFYVGTSTGLFISSDQGKTLEKEAEMGSNPVKILAIHGKTVLAASEKMVWSKEKNGRWEKIISNEGSAFQQILFRPEKGVLAITNNVIWQRDLDGIWRQLGGELPQGVQIKALAADVHNNDILYLGTDRGLLWSADSGASWELAKLYQGEEYRGQVNQVLPTDTSAIWLATESDGAVLGISKVARRNFLERWFGRG